MTSSDRRRVFVGLDGSLASLRALREAAALARQRRAVLEVVHVRPPERPSLPPLVGLLAQTPAGAWTVRNAADRADREAVVLIRRCVCEALGGQPLDIDVHYSVPAGRPAVVLARLGWRDDDLLVLGTGRRRWHHLLSRSVSRYCARHSRCPVLLTPPHELARAVRHRLRPRGYQLPRNPWKEFDRTSRREAHPIR